jgi:hypothetical protein
LITEFRTKNFKFRTRKKERLFHSETHVSAATVPEQRLQAWSLDVETRQIGCRTTRMDESSKT